MEALAQTVDGNGDVYFVPAFSGLFAPYWKSNARGVLAGLTRFANKGHIAPAALESVAYQTRDVLEAMEKDSQISIRELRADGGMVANELLMQFQSDILGVPPVRPLISETTALGAAYAAGLAVGSNAHFNPAVTVGVAIVSWLESGWDRGVGAAVGRDARRSIGMVALLSALGRDGQPGRQTRVLLYVAGAATHSFESSHRDDRNFYARSCCRRHIFRQSVADGARAGIRSFSATTGINSSVISYYRRLNFQQAGYTHEDQALDHLSCGAQLGQFRPCPDSVAVASNRQLRRLWAVRNGF